MDCFASAYRSIGLDAAAEDSVFEGLVTAKILEPGSKYDSIRVLKEAGAASASYATINKNFPSFAAEDFRDRIISVCANYDGIGPSSLVLYDVTTLFFESDEGDDLRTPGLSKERRIDPQITVGMLTDKAGFPLYISAFEGNKAETHTFISSVKSFIGT